MDLLTVAKEATSASLPEATWKSGRKGNAGEETLPGAGRFLSPQAAELLQLQI